MNEHSPNSNLNESDLLELALRLATNPGDSRTQHAQLLPGQLPDQLPVAIPFPEGSSVLGSLIRTPESITMLLDTPLSPEHVLTFYKNVCRLQGGKPPIVTDHIEVASCPQGLEVTVAMKSSIRVCADTIPNFV